MTMPDTLAIPRSPAVTEAAVGLPGVGGPVVAAGGGDGFAQTLADVMGPEGAVQAGAGEAVAGKAEAAGSVAMLDDLGRMAALLPGGQGDTAGEGAVAEAGSAGALQDALATVLPRVMLPSGDASEAENSLVVTDDGAEVADPLAALGLGPLAAAAPAVLPEGEAEVAVGQAVAAAMTGGAMQPMMQPMIRAQGNPQAAATGAAATGSAATGAAEGGAEAATGIEGSGDGADAPTVAGEVVARREAAGLTPVAVPATDRQAARAGAEPQGDAVPEGVTGITAAVTAAAGQVPQQAAQAVMPTQGAVAFAAPAPIAVDRPGWEGAIADRIAAELSGDGQQIDLEIAPEHLGRLKIRLDMTDGQAQVRFVTETPEAARLIQANEHRLSDALSRAGLSLGGQETTSRDPQGDRPTRGEGPAARFLERSVDVQAAPLPGRMGRGLVNLIA